MSDIETTRSDRFKEFAGEWFEKLVQGTAQVYGGKASDAVKLSPDEELTRWLQPTSPAARRAYEIGGSDEDAEVANTFWAHGMMGEQAKIVAQMQQAGAMPNDIATALEQQGLTDDQIFAACRSVAHQLGKQNSQNSRRKEAAYHKRMAERAQQMRMSRMQQQPPTITEVPDAAPTSPDL